MALFTAVITGLLYLGFLVVAPNAQIENIVGSSGIVFMMILLGSLRMFAPVIFRWRSWFSSCCFSWERKSLTLLTIIKYQSSAHIVGGICGSFFGFVKTKKLTGHQTKTM